MDRFRGNRRFSDELIETLIACSATGNDLLRGGQLVIHGFDPVQVTSLDWSADPFDHPHWRHRLHSLDFVWPLLKERSDQAVSVALDWLEQNPRVAPPSDFSWAHHTTAKRARVLVATYLLWPNDELEDGLRLHAEALRDTNFYDAGHNHAISQDTSLLLLGAVLDDEPQVEIARSRASEAVRLKVDPQGMVNEQAPAYQAYVTETYKELLRLSDACGLDLPNVRPDMAAMSAAMADLMMPDGFPVPIGDTYWDEKGQSPLPEVPEHAYTRIYDAGYVVVRDPADAVYAVLRFGPGRRFHGHDDHMALLFHAGGDTRLIEGGHVGYEQSPFRDHLRGPWAHNVVVLEDLTFDSSAETTLTRVGETYFEFVDRPYAGVVRTRAIDLELDPLTITIRDTIASPEARTACQLWHLPPTCNAVRSGGRVDVEFEDGVHMEISQHLPVDRMEIVSGSEDPLLGWVATRRHRRPTPVVVSSLRGRHSVFETHIKVEVPRELRTLKSAIVRRWQQLRSR